MRKHFGHWIWVVLVLASTLRSAGFQSFSNEISAASAGMGNLGFILLREDGVFSKNPALLSFLENKRIVVASNYTFMDTRSYYLEYNTNWKKHPLGIAAFFNQISDIELRDVPSPVPDGITSVEDASVTFATTGWIRPSLAWGIGLKYGYSNFYGYRADAYSMDISMVYRYKKMFFSSGLFNLGHISNKDGVNWDLPQELVTGLWVEELVKSSRHTLSAGVQGRVIFSDPKYTQLLSVGCEYSFHHQFFLRAGYEMGNDAYPLSFGAGLHYGRFAFHFALQTGDGELPNARFIQIQIGL